MVAARLHPIRPATDPRARLDEIAARRAELAAELVTLASEETAIVQALSDRAARLRPVGLSIREIAIEMRVSEMTVRKWIRAGLPVSQPAGGDLVVLVDDLDRWLRQQYVN